MAQRDLIRDQIEQMGRVLGKALADFLGFKSKGMINQGLEVSSQQLKSELDIDLGELTTLSNSDLKSYLLDRKFTVKHIEMLADYLSEVGKSKISDKNQTGKTYLNKSIVLYELVDEISRTICFEREAKKSEMKTLYNNT
tara:strand:+ start:77 stop:496 length:420 start_codon:yes stop_codon:yes gene_type:complete